MVRHASTISKKVLAGQIHLAIYRGVRTPTMKALHWHEGVELTVIHEGVGSFTVGDTDYPISPGLVLTIGEHVPHHARVVPGVPYTVTSCVFGELFLERVLDPGFARALALPFEQSKATGVAARKLSPEAHRRLCAALDRLALAAEEGPAEQHLAALALAESILLIGRTQARGVTGQAAKGASPPRLVRQAMELLSREHASPWTLAALADRLHVSRFYLHRLFAEGTGMTPREYLQQCRLQEARLRLLQSDLPISEIAQAVGFSSPALFSHTFRRVFGISPSDYRSGCVGEREKARAR